MPRPASGAPSSPGSASQPVSLPDDGGDGGDGAKPTAGPNGPSGFNGRGEKYSELKLDEAAVTAAAAATLRAWLEDEVVARLRRLDEKLDALTSTSRPLGSIQFAEGGQSSSGLESSKTLNVMQMSDKLNGLVRQANARSDLCTKEEQERRQGSLRLAKRSMQHKAQLRRSAFEEGKNYPHHHHEHEQWGSRFAMHPNSKFATVWSISVALAVLYICWLVPFTIGFSWWRKSEGIANFQQFLEILFWVDMCQSFRTGFEHDGHLHMGLKSIAKHYLQFWFWIDLVANVPWEEVVGVFFEDSSQRKSFKIMKWMKLSKLIRLTRWRKLLNSIGGGRGNYVSLATCLFTIVFLVHGIGCLFMNSLGLCENYPPYPYYWKYGYEVNDTIVMNDKSLGWRCVQANVGVMYGESLHVGAALVLGQSHTGMQAMNIFVDASSSDIQDVFAESFVTMIVGQVFGLILVAAFFANMAKVIVLPNWRETAFWLRWDAVRRELEQHADRIPEKLSRQVRHQMLAHFRRNDFGPLQLAADDLLSNSLRYEVARHMKPMISAHPCFKWADPGLMASLTVAFRQVHYSANEVIYRYMDLPEGLYILEKGEVDLITPDEMSFDSIEVMTIFGETPVLSVLDAEEQYRMLSPSSQFIELPRDVETTQIDSAIAIEESMVMMLPFEDLRRLCIRHPRLLTELISRYEQKHHANSECSELDVGDATTITKSDNAIAQ